MKTGSVKSDSYLISYNLNINMIIRRR